MNRLGSETSPYLLQHANNPVHWWPWGEEALAEAQRTNRPILLSVGYAACHWCHVMAHESFESPEVAAVMNALFVNIKVDREERPDVDAIYMQALQIMGEHGGWPLTMFCTPRGEPFWGGTYFPHPARYGRPSFIDVLQGVAQAFRDKPQDVETNRAGLLRALRSKAVNKAVEFAGDGPLFPLSLLDQIAERIVQQCDLDWGGFGQAPKFPSPYVFELLWRGWLRNRSNAKLRDAVTVTLDRMCQGGIYDHLGGGFARYVDGQRMAGPAFREDAVRQCAADRSAVPRLAGDEEPALRRAHRRDLRLDPARDGGRERRLCRDLRRRFAKASRASSMSGTQPRSTRCWASRTARSFARPMTSHAGGNWEHHNILHRNRAPALLGDAEEQRLAVLRARLKAVRDKRVWPGWDDKVLADWNGLMIAALANASAVFQRDDWLAAAVRAWRFVMDADARRRRPPVPFAPRRQAAASRHARRLRQHGARRRGAVRGRRANAAYLDEAQALIAVLDRHFADPEAGGYFMTADDAADLIVRSKHCHDNASPAGNGTLVGVFARLWVLTGDAVWHDKARHQVAAFAGELDSNFFPLMTLLNGYETLQSAVELVIVGDPSAAATEALRRAVYARSLPDKIVRRLSPAARSRRIIPPPARASWTASLLSTCAAT